MSMRKIAFWIGLFSLVMGLLTYDREVATAPLPVVTGIVVIILAAFGWIPEFNRCETCGKLSFGKKGQCIRCGAEIKKSKLV